VTELKIGLLSSVSHDLRTPLATIRAAAGTLRPGSGLSVEEQAESADAIDREVEYLNRLVTNLLDLSRIEAGTLKAERDVFVLDDLIGRTIERLRTRLAGRPLTVELDVPPVEVDPIFLDESLTNALENAIKYTPPATPIRVRAAVLPDEPFVRLSIEDAGPGVPAEHLPRLFERFYRVPGTARSSRSGTGVGLAVVRGLTEAMGGRSSCRRSDLGGWHRPRPPTGPLRRSRRATPVMGRSGCRPGPVLIVEDDEETQHALTRLGAGYRIQEAADGRTRRCGNGKRAAGRRPLDLGGPTSTAWTSSVRSGARRRHPIVICRDRRRTGEGQRRSGATRTTTSQAVRRR
jgi:hypothetical protein